MKTFLIPLLTGMVISCSSSAANESRESITREFTLKKDAASSTLAVYNLSGSVQVEGYSGDRIVLEIEKIITAPDEAVLQKGKNEVRPEFAQNEDSITAYIAEPYDLRPGRQNCNRNHNKTEYSFRLNYKIKVPKGMNLKVSTITDGNVLVDDVSGNINLMNVNGSIHAEKAAGKTDAFTVNGDIQINYNSNPSDSSSYKTISGDIHIGYVSDLSADMQFKSMNGEFYTDFPAAELLPVVALKNRENEGNGTVYQLEKTTKIRIGKGIRQFRFETLSGNVYIKKLS